MDKSRRGELRSRATSLKGEAKNDIISKIEGFLSSELHSYVCSICYDLMIPPER